MNWQTFLIAARFLTRLPLPEPKHYSTESVAQSAAYYPLIGFLIGLALIALAQLLDQLDHSIAAVIILIAWVWITGALHLDGFADTVDAWVGGLGDKQRTLDIMQDPHTGTMATVAIVLLLLTKWLGISYLLSHDLSHYLLWLPVLSRLPLAPFFMLSPYAKETGLGVDIAEYIERPLTWGIIACFVFISLYHLTVLTLLVLLALMLMVFFTWRYVVLKRLDGVTGDTAGALVEIMELVLLLSLAFVAY